MSVDYFTRVQASAGWARSLESFTRFVSPQPGQRTLDVGCGPGALVRRLAVLGCDAHGVDHDPAMVTRARELANGSPSPAAFHDGPAARLPFGDGQFHIVTATNVIFLQREPLAALREMARVCQTNGLVAMLNPSPRLSAAAAQAHVEAVGLRDFDAHSFVNWARAAEQAHRLSADDVRALFSAAGLAQPEIVEKIGPGLALFAKAHKLLPPG